MFDAKKLLDMMMGASGQQGGASGGQAAGGGLLGSVLGKAGQIFGQATQGVKEGAQAVDARTGASQKADGAVRSATGGQGISDLFTRAKDMMGQNQLATGAALGGLAGLLLGTKTGRGVAGSAAKMGALALVGGLAYKAYQNYSSGKPLLGGPATVDEAPAASPYGHTGDETQDNEAAMLLIRAMIAAAASDGLIDNEERSRIIGGLEQAGLDVAAAKFLDTEFAAPASIGDLVKAATTPALAQEVYTAARIAIDPDTAQEKAFLAALAQQLKLEAGFIDHIEAAAQNAKNAVA
jgi:uncharacterized membrane protein YebE (DUF533 family)